MVTEVRALTANPQLVKERRQHITGSSLKLFLNRGYHAATVRELCKASDMSVGALYSYIRCKDDILRLIMDEMVEEWRRFLAEVRSMGGSASQVMPRAVEQYLRFMDRYQDMNLLAYREFLSLPKYVCCNLTDMEETTVAMFRELLERGRGDGVFDFGDAELVAWDIVIIGSLWVLKRWGLRRSWTLEDFIAGQTELVMKALTQGGAGRRTSRRPLQRTGSVVSSDRGGFRP